MYFFFSWDSPHARLKRSYYKALIYKKKKKITNKQETMFRKNLNTKYVF